MQQYIYSRERYCDHMTTDPSDPLDGVDPELVAPEDVDEAEVQAALTSSNPLVEQRGVGVCETLAEADIDAVRPFLDEIGSLLTEDNVAIVLRAIEVLKTVARDEPTAIESVLSDLVSILDSDLAGIQLEGVAVLGVLVIDRPDLCSPYAHRLIKALQATELEPETDFGEIVDDQVTRQTIEEHEWEERQRRISARQSLINVVIAVAEAEPRTMVAEVDDLIALLDDDNPNVTGGAINALRAIAEAEPDAVIPVSDRLVDCLDHDSEAVRAHTIQALGHIGDDTAASDLRAVAETDPNEDIRSIAAETADFLEET
jgi:HEAT repeat protein